VASLRIRKAKALKGTLVPPPDKSITHRAVILSSLANGRTQIENPLLADDCMRTINAFRTLGVMIEIVNGVALRIDGRPDGLLEAEDVLDLGNSGTTMRLMLGVLAGQEIYTVLSGDRSLRARPMRRVTDPLTRMGAKISGRGNGDYAPLTIIGSSHLKPIHWELPMPSAQVKSAILLAGLFADGVTSISEPSPSRDHTERMLPRFGVEIMRDGLKVSVSGPAELESTSLFRIPGDPSSAAFFIVCALLLPRSRLIVKDVCLNPTRVGMINALKRMGAKIEVEEVRELDGEIVGDLVVRSSELKATTIEEEEIPGMIDEIPLIALAASFADGRTSIQGARELRVKESDRLKAIRRELGRLGAKIEELEDGLVIEGPSSLKGSRVNSWGDHRIAMMLAIAGLLSKGETLVEDIDCIRISYPDFEKTIMELVDD
jgi:3-phosphoshikimate 1-carboxyvinyltransferase